MVKPVEKNSQILKKYSLKSKESKNKNKWCVILSTDEGEMTKKNRVFQLGWASASWPGKSVNPVEKNSQILTKYFLKSKKSNKKKMVHNSELG